MPQFRKKPVEVEAVRYGKDDTGRWYRGCVQRAAAFMLGREIDAELSDGEVMGVLRPTALWDPPESADLQMWDGVAHGEWLPLAPGDWIVKGVKGEFYPCKPDIFEATYEAVTE
jgi:hypothetical protein